jgi:hypothetical protein
VKGSRQVDREDRIPFVDRKLVDRRDMLDAGVVDKQVDRAEARDCVLHHRFDLLGLRHVGAVIGDL